MDLSVIGKFIKEQRKAKGLTQIELALKLNVSEKTISKWENGNGIPDTNVLPKICEILEVSLNELINGERISSENYVDKAEEKLLEMANREKLQNKRLMMAMWTILITSTIFYVGIVTLAYYALTEGTLLGTIIVISTATFVIANLIGLRFEVDAGYYECKNCHHRFKATYMQVLSATHMSTTRHLKCPKCHKRTWAKKVMTK